MVMIMNTNTNTNMANNTALKISAAKHMPTGEYHDALDSLRAALAREEVLENNVSKASESSPAFDDYPAMPSAEEYTQGMDALREELRNIDLELPTARRPKSPVRKRELKIDEYLNGEKQGQVSVDGYLKLQARKRSLARLPEFEQEVANAIESIRNEQRSLSYRLLITNWIIAGIIIVGVWLWLL